MPFPLFVKNSVYYRAGGKCECVRSCDHHIGTRCNAVLRGEWYAHYRKEESAGGDNSLSNCEALCQPCHKNREICEV
jgi:hypothetical protein